MNLEPLISARAQKTMASEINKEVDKVAKESVKKLFTRPVKSDEVDGDDDFDFSDSDFDLSYNDNDDEDNDPVSHELLTNIADSDSEEPEEVRKILKSIEEKDSFDIFVDIGDYWQKKGQIVRYQINKSNKMLTKVDHPCSWEDIQAKFGGGHYKIIAKLPALNNRYLKSEARVLENAPININGTSSVSSRLEAKSENKEGLSMSELIATLERKTEQAEARAERLRLEADERVQRAEDKAKRESKERMEEQRMMFDKLTENKGGGVLAELTPLLGLILPKLLEKKEDNTMDMMMKIQEMNQKSIESMQKANERMFTSIQDTIKAMAEQKSSKKDSSDFDALTVMKMIEDAKNAGFEQFKMLEELAEEKAAAREELRGPSEPSQKDSTIDTLIKSLAPVAAQALAGGMGQQSQQVQRPVARPVQVLPSTQPRGAVSRASNPVRSYGQGTNAEGVNGVKVQATQERKTQPSNPVRKEGMGSAERNLLTAPEKKSFLNADTEEAVSVGAQLNNASSEKPAKDLANVERIYGVILPIAITAYTTEGYSIAKAAEDSISELSVQGIELSLVIRDFDDETLNAILTSVPDEKIKTLVKGLHNEIIARIKTRIG